MLLHLNVVMMMQAQYAIENAAWSFNLAAPNFGNFVNLCCKFLRITGDYDFSNKGNSILIIS